MAVVIRIKYLDRNLLLACYSAKCSPSACLIQSEKSSREQEKKVGRGFEWLLHGSAAAAVKALWVLKGVRAAPAPVPPSPQGRGGCTWVGENKLPPQSTSSPLLSTQAACWGSPCSTYCPWSQGNGCKDKPGHGMNTRSWAAPGLPAMCTKNSGFKRSDRAVGGV